MENKRAPYGLIVIVVAVVIVGGIIIGSYNGLVTSREAVVTAQANIDTSLQRRADLIPNLVSTCKSFAAHETEVFDKVLEARQQLMGAATIEEKATADGVLTQALKGINVIVENYPELKSDATYISLMDELAGSENRIAVARKDYNTTVQSYNNRVIRFPGSILASMFGFQKMSYFEAAEGAANTPDVGEMLK